MQQYSNNLFKIRVDFRVFRHGESKSGLYFCAISVPCGGIGQSLLEPLTVVLGL